MILRTSEVFIDHSKMGSQIQPQIVNVLKDAASFMVLKKQLFEKQCNEELDINENLPILVCPIDPGTWESNGKVCFIISYFSSKDIRLKVDFNRRVAGSRT